MRKLYHRIVVIFTISLCSTIPALADDEVIKIDKMANAIESVKSNLELSYLTFGGGYDGENIIKFDDLYYEGQIYVHYNMWDNVLREKITNSNNHIFQIYAPIRINLRQYRSSSSPVKTPSFNPGIKVFYFNREMVKGVNDFHYYSLGFHHYSNGQSGSHYDPITGIINTENGSFSSDYFEASYYKVTSKFLDWYKINNRIYITSKNFTWEDEQTDYYEYYLLEFEGKKRGPSISRYKFENVQLGFSVAYKFGRKYISPGIDADVSDNFQYKIDFTRPVSTTKQSDLYFYLRWDLGYDYYNINYQNKINRIQFGIAGKTF